MKLMKKVFAILHEPASYTVDRNRAVYDKMGIRYCYINSSSLAKANYKATEDVLMKMTLKQRFVKLKNILKDNDIIIMNGYTGGIFLMLFFLNIFYRKTIGIDSDTQLNIPAKSIKKFVKSIYLRTVFSNKRIYGLPGGTGSHTDLFRHYGMPDNHIFLMPMMVDNSYFCYPPRENLNPFIFLFVGRIIGIKNIETLIIAFLNTFDRNESVNLRIIGEGEDLANLQDKYKNKSNVCFAGAKFAEELRQEYRNAHVLVLPSSHEPWGLVVNEAMAAGMPVIISDKVGAGWDLVNGHDTGFIFRHYDINGLQKAMRQLANNKNIYIRYAYNAYHRLNNEWNYDLYRECLERFIKSV